jgi:hypothetical protein
MTMGTINVLLGMISILFALAVALGALAFAVEGLFGQGKLHRWFLPLAERTRLTLSQPRLGIRHNHIDSLDAPRSELTYDVPTPKPLGCLPLPQDSIEVTQRESTDKQVCLLR